MGNLIGRKKELEVFKSLLSSKKSEFVAVYGRRRVGKTFLIRNAFEQKFIFQMTGIANASLTEQLSNFHIALQKADSSDQYTQATNWLSAFQQLINHLEKSKKDKKVVFIDELPWFDTRNSGFIRALEHFWNSWASQHVRTLFLLYVVLQRHG